MKFDKTTSTALQNAIKDKRSQIQFTVDELEQMRTDLRALEKLLDRPVPTDEVSVGTVTTRD